MLPTKPYVAIFCHTALTRNSLIACWLAESIAIPSFSNNCSLFLTPHTYWLCFCIFEHWSSWIQPCNAYENWKNPSHPRQIDSFCRHKLHFLLAQKFSQSKPSHSGHMGLTMQCLRLINLTSGIWFPLCLQKLKIVGTYFERLYLIQIETILEFHMTLLFEFSSIAKGLMH